MKLANGYLASALALTAFGLLAATTGCAAAAHDDDEVGASEQALTGGAVTYWEDNSGGNWLYGISMQPPGSQFTPTCFLSGVVGNLAVGHIWEHYYSSVYTGPAVVEVGGGNALTVGPALYARGGFYINQTGVPTFDPNDKVGGQATCVNHPWAAGKTIGGNSDPFHGYSDELIVVALSTRQCFLSGLTGGEGNWTNTGSYARVEKRVSSDWPHFPFWWLEANIPTSLTPANNNWPSVSATCIDFPAGTTITSSPPDQPVVGPADVLIASGSTVLDATACGITGIEGALSTNSYTSGAYMKPPSETGNGTWRLVVAAGKKAHWACAN